MLSERRSGALALIAGAGLLFGPQLAADDRSVFGGVPIRTTYPNPIIFLDNYAFVVGYEEIRKVPRQQRRAPATVGTAGAGTTDSSRSQKQQPNRAVADPLAHTHGAHDHAT